MDGSLNEGTERRPIPVILEGEVVGHIFPFPPGRYLAMLTTPGQYAADWYPTESEARQEVERQYRLLRRAEESR